jgi:large subunit ribosomal protein L29
MKAKELKNKSVTDLNQSVVDLKTELFNLRFQLATGELDNPMRIKSVKKDIARVKTVLRERELNINAE